MSFLDLLQKVKQRGGAGGRKWVALCPCHDEKTPSLTIKENSSGGYVIHCFGCGANGVDVFKALNLPFDELFGDKSDSSFIPNKVKDEYHDDKMFLAIYDADVSRGVTPTYRENCRRRLALSRIAGIEKRFKYFG